MTIFRQICTLILCIAVLSACEGYVVTPARIDVEITGDAKEHLFAFVSTFLRQEGFQDFGKQTAVMDLIRNAPIAEAAKQEELARLNKEYTFLNQQHDLRVVLSDYSATERPGTSTGTSSTNPYIGIEIFDERPGGFGPYGDAFYLRFLSMLRQRFGASVQVVAEPPPTNPSEYRRVTFLSWAGGTVWWCLAFSCTLLVAGFITLWLLRFLAIPIVMKRLIFTLLNTWLAAPLPFPAASIAVILLPNLFEFPWTDWSDYSRFASFAKISFACAFVLCAVLAALVPRARWTRRTPGTELSPSTAAQR